MNSGEPQASLACWRCSDSCNLAGEEWFCDKCTAIMAAEAAYTAKLDESVRHIPHEQLLNKLISYSRWSGDDFAINQPSDEDGALGSAYEREVLRRLKLLPELPSDAQRSGS